MREAGFDPFVIEAIRDIEKDTFNRIDVYADSTVLNRLYVKFNELFFDNNLPGFEYVELFWTKRLKKAVGRCTSSTKSISIDPVEVKKAYLIEMSVQYHQRHPGEISSTLLHEIIHIKTMQHYDEFEKWMNYINESVGYELVDRRPLEWALSPKWIYICQDCGYEFPRLRRARNGGKSARCSVCDGGLREVKKR